MPSFRSESRSIFSQRTAFERGPNALAQLLAEKQKCGERIVDLTVSNPTHAGLPTDEAALARALAMAPADYEADPLGTPTARRAVAQYWAERGVAIGVERLALTASTSEAYAALFKLFCNPGDEVLVARPSYPLLDELARYEAVRLVDYALAYDGAWHVDFSSVERGLSERTRAIIVVSPNNPTGNVLSAEEHVKLSGYGLPIICDEVFGLYPWSANDTLPTALQTAASGLTVVLDGLSKAAALPQLKVAWMSFAGEPVLLDEALSRLEFVLDAQLSVNGPAQAGLRELLTLGASRRNRVLERLRANLALLDARLVGSAVNRPYATGGWYAVLRLPSVHGELEWVQGFLERASVWVQPGWFYDLPGDAHCIVSLLTPEAEFAEGVERLLADVAGRV